MDVAVKRSDCVNSTGDKQNLTSEIDVTSRGEIADVVADFLQRLEEISDDTEFEAEIRILEEFVLRIQISGASGFDA